MKKIFLCLILMFMVSVAGADTVRIWWGGPDSRVGYQIDSGWVLHHYGNNIDTLFDTIYIDATNIDTFVVITGTGEHKVAIEGYYDGYPEWYEIKDWPVTLTIGTDLSGAGGYVVTVYAVDTSVAFDTVSGISITVKDMTGTEKGHVTTLTDGSAIFNLDSGSYVFSSRTTGGYIWATDTATIIATDTTLASTLWGYNIAIGAPSGDSVCRVYGYAYAPTGTSAQGATVKWSLPGTNIYDVCNSAAIVNTSGSAPVDANGLWTLDLYYSQCLQRSSTASTSDSILYNITITYPSGSTVNNKSFDVPSADSVEFTW